MSDTAHAITTKRLRLRPPSQGDLPFFISLLTNNEVMRHIPPNCQADTTAEAEDRFQRILHHWSRYDYGMFVAENVTDGKLVGYCGLRFLETIEKIELGYIIDQPYWGMGMASEMSEACVNYAEDVLQAQEVIAVTRPGNRVSQKILTKRGFIRNPSLDGNFHGIHHIFFSLRFSGKS